MHVRLVGGVQFLYCSSTHGATAGSRDQFR